MILQILPEQFAIAFGLGMLWEFLVGMQTQLLVGGKSLWHLGLWVCLTSLVWGYLVRAIVFTPGLVIPYAIGTAFGMVITKKLWQVLPVYLAKRREQKKDTA